MPGSFFAKHWRALVVAGGINGPYLWSGVKWLWDWAGRFDLIANHVSSIWGAGAMITLLSDPPPWTIFPTAAFGIAIIWGDIKHPNWWRRASAAASKYRVMLTICVAAACFLVGSYFAVMAYREYRYPPPPPAPEDSPLLKRAQSDFRISGAIGQDNETIDLQDIGVFPVNVKIWLYSDLISMGRFLVFYVPNTLDIISSPTMANLKPRGVRSTYETIIQMAGKYQDIIKRADSKGGAGLGDMGAENWRYSSNAIFTGAIYVYYEGNLTEEEKVSLRQIYKDRGAMIFLRDRRYMVESSAIIAR